MAEPGVPLRPLNVQNLRTHIEAQLRGAILNGTFNPGDRLIESAIAEQLGVSRAPVREVLSALEREGLIVNIPRRGNFVLDFTDRDVQEIYSLRTILELGAAERALGRLTPADTAAIQALIDDQLGAQVAGGALDQLVEADLLIHERICSAAGHGRLLQLWHSMRWQTQLLMAVTNRTYELPSQPRQNHQRILDCLKNCDLPSVRSELSSHLRDAETRAHEALAALHAGRVTATL